MDKVNKMSFHVSAKRIDAHGSQAYCKEGEITLDTDLSTHVKLIQPFKKTQPCRLFQY